MPAGSGWQGSWNASVSASAANRLANEARDPESFAARHRFAVGSPVADGEAAFLSGETAVIGSAPQEFEAAAEGLRSAFERRDPGIVIDRLADLAIAATDLADPFQVVGLDHPEPRGARAAFSDLIVGSLPAALEAHDIDQGIDPYAAGLALADTSAGARGAIEQAIADNDVVRIEALRRERLEAALTLARAIVSQAWRAAGQLPLDPVHGSQRMRISPNPVGTEAAVSFSLPAAGQATLELFDVAGRRVWSQGLGSLAQGPHTVNLSGSDIDALPVGYYIARMVAGRYVALGRFAHVSR